MNVSSHIVMLVIHDRCDKSIQSTDHYGKYIRQTLEQKNLENISIIYKMNEITSKCKIVSAADIAQPFIDEVSNLASKLPDNEKPFLLGILANDDPAAEMYAKWTSRACSKVGIKFSVKKVARVDLEDTILDSNEDSSIHGIIIYYPVFGSLHDGYLQDTVSFAKDVEGLCYTYRFNMYHNIRTIVNTDRKCIIPCTPLAVVKCLEHVGVYNNILEIGNRLQDITITVINRSEVVGRPLAALLANDGAKVFSVDLDGVLEFHRGVGLRRHKIRESEVTLDEALAQSDVVITGVPSPKYKVDTSKLKDNVVAVNFSSNNNFNDDIVDKASVYVSSVGKVTIAMLQRNLLRLFQYQKESVSTV